MMFTIYAINNTGALVIKAPVCKMIDSNLIKGCHVLPVLFL